MFVSVIIPAAGYGRRFGGTKQFYDLCGRPVVLWSLKAFEKVSSIKEIVLIIPPDRYFPVKEICQGIAKEVKIVTGSNKERYDSVKRGIKYVSKRANLVCIHDAVRPFIKPGIINQCIKMADKYGAAIVAVPAYDTVKYVEDNFIKNTLDRSKIWLVQTPQIFRRRIIEEAYRIKTNIPVTDDSQLVEQIGYKVRIVKGDIQNIKITTKEDLRLAEKIASL